MSGQSLRIDLRASPILTVLTVAVFGSAATILFDVVTWPAGQVAATLMAALGVLAAWRVTLLRAANAPVSLCLNRDSRLVACLHGGGEAAGLASDRRYVSRWIVVLQMIQSGGGRRTILVARDMLAVEEFRRLRLWALWNAVPAARHEAVA